MEVAGVEAEHLLIPDRVTEVELVRADDIALAADPEELALDGIQVVVRVEFFREHLVERIRQPPRGDSRSTGVSL